MNDKKSETAALIMGDSFPVFPLGTKCEAVEREIKENANSYESLQYVYVVDESDVLKGVFSIKELFQNKSASKVDDLMIKDLITVRPSTDQEHAALKATKHSIKAIPVVDKSGVLLGVIASDTIIDIIDTEAFEDLLLHAGVGTDALESTSAVNAFKRIPWLVIGLLGGLLAASVIGAFEQLLENEILIAAFIPAIVYMADAVGTQTQTIFVRALATNRDLEFKLYALKEIATSCIVALVLGLLALFGAYAITLNFDIASVIGISLVLTVVTSSFIAILLPFIFFKLKFDPAIASGPLATIVRDILSLVIYLVIAVGIL